MAACRRRQDTHLTVLSEPLRRVANWLMYGRVTIESPYSNSSCAVRSAVEAGRDPVAVPSDLSAVCWTLFGFPIPHTFADALAFAVRFRGRTVTALHPDRRNRR